MYKWQTFLGGIASAGILAVGVAVPALAQAAPATTGSTSATVAQTLAGAGCQLTGLPMSGEIASASGALSTTGSCGSSSSTPSSTSGNTLVVNDSQNSTQTPSGANASGITSLPGLNTVAGMIPALSSATSQVPAVGSLTGGSSSTDSPAGTTNGIINGTANGANDPLGSSDQGTSGSSVLPGSLSGVTGALPVDSLTGSLPDVGGVAGSPTGSGQ